MFPGSSTNTLQNTVPSNMKNTVVYMGSSANKEFDEVLPMVSKNKGKKKKKIKTDDTHVVVDG